MSLLHPIPVSSAGLSALLAAAEGDVLFLADPRVAVTPGPRMFERMAQAMRDTGAGWVYSDSAGHARIDYRPGSLRDTFDSGPVVALSVPLARDAGFDASLRWGALYDLRLRLSERAPVVRVPEPLYASGPLETRPTGEAQFDYVDPRNRDVQLEMERIATEHLRRIGALLPPVFAPVPPCDEPFPVVASVVIPVRNRERTILDAVASALSQQAPFAFNVVVVDNHSTDGTTEMLRGVRDPRLVHVVPERRDLGIGGCWDEAVFHPRCGRYAVQLDSDDLYANEGVLARIVSGLESGPYAMVVASYTMVDFALNEIPPGLVDHREWTRENGRNNALRVNGFGAPRAFDVSVLRKVGFPNVSYGEDYAVCLRISREWEIGRIWESVYLCRRWEGNSDSALPLETRNRYDAYKDWLRTVELAARKRATGAAS
ncbi:MAG: glycosyltransferase family 2 protein [Thermoanaerobaculia bacterium]